jgi:uncharacterized coiled-coil protein SlyX
MNKNLKKIFIFTLFLSVFAIITKTQEGSIKAATAKIMRTRIALTLSLYFAQIKNGSSFTFHPIAHDTIDATQPLIKKHEIVLQYDQAGTLKNINDGKKTPIFLGSIPYKQSHIDPLNNVCNRCEQGQNIGIFTLNEPWEVQTAGLSKLIKNNKNIVQFHYPTPDFTAPSIKHLIQAVHDLKNRDEQNLNVALIHCKAGRGRSATVAGAYVMYLMHKAEQNITIDEIEKYLISHRHLVHLSQAQKNILKDFYKELKNAENFDNLYAQYKK